jgi:hypothetical protein
MKKVLALFLCSLTVGCATGPSRRAAPKALSRKELKNEQHAQERRLKRASKKEQKKEEKKERKKDTLTGADIAPPVTLTQDAGTLGETVKRISEEVGGSLVLMNGIEGRPVGPLAFKRAEFGKVVEQLATLTGCKYEAYPNYWFVYPEGYEPVLEVTVAGVLDPAYANLTAGMSFGYGTPLYAAFQLLSNSLSITLVADNIVAESKCGALTLVRIPLSDALDAILKSARALKGRFQVESTPEYIFIYATENTTPRTVLLNGEALSPEQNAVLDKPANVILPNPSEDPAHMKMVLSATPLAKVLDVLSRQLGVKVMAEPGLEEFPVNPVVLNRVRIRTAIDLIIRQWYQPEVGYEFANNQIIIERRK